MNSTEMETLKNGLVKTSVWWDIENCPVPNGWDAHGIAQNISSALAKINYPGPVSIFAYGDTNRIPSSVQHALSSTGVALNHVPYGVKDASDKKILVDMLFWAVDNPSPATFLLISGDQDFSNALHRLRMRRYDILLAHPGNVSEPLTSAAKVVWLWTSLAAGGCPRTGNDSSQVVDGCHHSDTETSRRFASEPSFPSQAMGSDSEGGRVGDSENTGNYVPRSSNQTVQQDAKRNKLPSNGGTSDIVRVCTLCKVVCHTLESFTAHLSGKRHAAQSGSVPHGGAQAGVGGFSTPWGSSGPSNSSARAQAGVSTKPSKDPNLVNPVWCNICQIICKSKIDYENHVYGKKHQMNLEVKLGKAKKPSTGPIEFPGKDMTEKKKVTGVGPDTGAGRFCGLCRVECPCQAAFESHLKGRKHVAMVKKQAEELFGAEKFQEGSCPEKLQPREEIKEVQFHSREVQEDINCLERQNAVLTERCDATEMIAKEFRLSHEEQIASEHELPPSAESFSTEPSCKFPAVKGVRNASAASAECLEEKVESLKKKFIKGGAEADAIMVCDLCKVVCNEQTVFDSHLKGRKHAGNVEKQREELVSAKKFQEGSSLEKHHQPGEATKEFQFQSGEMQENMNCLEKQNAEMSERCAASERRAKEFCLSDGEVQANENTLLPSAEQSHSPVFPIKLSDDILTLKQETDLPGEEQSCGRVETKKQEKIKSLEKQSKEPGEERKGSESHPLSKAECIFTNLYPENLTSPVWCNLCKIRCSNKTKHICGEEHQLNLLGMPDQIVFGSLLIGQRHAANVEEQQGEALSHVKRIQEKGQPSKVIVEVGGQTSWKQPVQNAASIFTDLKQTYPAPEEARECKDERLKKGGVTIVKGELVSKDKQDPNGVCRIC